MTPFFLAEDTGPWRMTVPGRQTTALTGKTYSLLEHRCQVSLLSREISFNSLMLKDITVSSESFMFSKRGTVKLKEAGNNLTNSQCLWVVPH